MDRWLNRCIRWSWVVTLPCMIGLWVEYYRVTHTLIPYDDMSQKVIDDLGIKLSDDGEDFLMLVADSHVRHEKIGFAHRFWYVNNEGLVDPYYEPGWTQDAVTSAFLRSGYHKEVDERGEVWKPNQD